MCGGRRGKGRCATVRGRVPPEATGTYARSAEAARGVEDEEPTSLKAEVESNRGHQQAMQSALTGVGAPGQGTDDDFRHGCAYR